MLTDAGPYQGSGVDRLYALGMDAYRLACEIRDLRSSTRQVSGASGTTFCRQAASKSLTGLFFVRVSLSLSRQSFRDNDLREQWWGSEFQHHWSEDFALDRQSKGLRLVERNYRTRRGDRPDLAGRYIFGICWGSVPSGRPSAARRNRRREKQSRLRFTAEVLQQYRNGYDTPCRFDVFAVGGKMPDPDWQWIQNAF